LRLRGCSESFMSIDYARSQLAKTGLCTSLRPLFAFLEVNERNGDFSPIIG
jgi:hypothetical protein